MAKLCATCKHVHEPYERSICRSCDITDPKVHLGRAKHTKWEPKDEEPDCEKCKHEDKGPEEDPCQERGIDGDNYFEPKDAEKLCKNCGVKSIEDQMMVCTHCYDHNKWRPNEDKKMSESLIKDDNYVVKRKTKAQLMEELERKNNEIAELKKELERSTNYEQYLDAAKEMRSMVDAFVESGFTEEQAIIIVAGVIGQATRQRLIL